jgi:adenosyl cobinamide kinase/adenosyl cobinamide phosphate guanylyltransferase
MTWLLWLGVALVIGVVGVGVGYVWRDDRAWRDECEWAHREAVRRANDAAWAAMTDGARRRARREEPPC